MATFEEYTRKKKKGTFTEYTRAKLGDSYGTAPVRETPEYTPRSAKVTTTQDTKQDTKQKESTWFKSGAFDDGYQFGDLTGSLFSTLGDAALGIVKGGAKLVEGVTDLALYGASEVAGIFDEDAEKEVKSWAKHNTVDAITKDADEFLDDNSFLGDRMEAVEEGIGQVAGIILTGGIAGAAGVSATAATTGMMFASSMGSGIGEALESGASEDEAWAYGAISGTVDAVSEMIFGGLGKGVNALGLSKGLSSLDDTVASALSSKLKSSFAKNLVQFGVKASAEGAEEVIAGVGSAFAKKMTYMSEADMKQLVKDEKLLDQFVVGAVTSGIAQSGYVPAMKKGSLREANKTGRDFITGFTANEQKVIDKEVENRVAEAEKDGKKLTKKEKSKIYDEVKEDIERGGISIDTIEEVLGGDTDSYKAYKEAIDSDNATIEELKELYGEKAVEAEFASRVAEAEQSGQTLTHEQKEQLHEKIAAEKQQQFAEEVNGILENSKRGELRDALTADLKKMLVRDVKGKKQSDNYLLESYAEVARRGQKFEADVNQYKNENARKTIQNILDAGVANNSRRTHQLANTLAKISADKGIIFNATDAKRLSETSFGVNGKTVNGFVTKDGITINVDSPKYLNSVVGHEISHVLEKNADLYKLLQDAAFEFAKSRKSSNGKFENEYMERLFNARQLYKDVDGYKGTEGHDAIKKEVVSDLVGDYLFTDSKFIQNLSVNHRNVFQKIFDEIKYLCKIATAGSKEKRELEKVKKAFEDAYRSSTTNAEAQKNTAEDGGAKYSIVALEDGKVYVDASRNVIKGKTVDEMRSDISQFFSDLLGENSSLDIHTIEGDTLTITKAETAHKARDDYQTINGQRVKMTNEEFAVKMHVEAHIDEIAEVSTKIGKSGDNKNHSFAKDGFTYRRAYFKDFDGQYYEITLSIGNNGTVATVYNVGKIKEGVPPSAKIIAAVGSKPLGGTPSDGIVPQKEENVKRVFSLSDSDGKQLTKEQSEYFKDSKIKDKDGNLIKLYHGTMADFTEFDIGMSGDNYNGWSELGKGVYLTPDKKMAQYYADNVGLGRDTRIMELYANVTNPFNTMEAVEFDISDLKQKYELTDFDEAFIKKAGYRLVDFLKTHKEDTRAYLTGKGYDGVWDMSQSGELNQVVIYDANQAKNIDNTAPTSDPDIRYSLSADSKGRELSDGQKAYFKDSKIVDDDGHLKVMYHGTPNGDFSVFKDGTYFTEHKWYADLYQNPSASSISTGKVASAPKTFEVYLDIKKPFDLSDAEARKIYINDYIKGGNAVGINPYLSDAEYDKISSIDWTEGEDLRDFLIDNGYDYDGLVLDEGATGGYGDDVKSRGKSYVVFSPEQVKNTDNLNPTSDPDIRFSLSKPVEETKDLVAMHNVRADKLLEAFRLGGLPSPSVAITKSDILHDNYGDITLLLQKDAIDPQADSRNKVYGSDAWTPTISNARTEYEVDFDKMRAFEKKLAELAKKTAGGAFSSDSLVRRMGVEDVSEQNAARLAERLSNSDEVRAAYLAEMGQTIDPEYKTKVYNKHGNKALQTFIDTVGVEKLATLAAESKLGDMTGIRAEEDTVRKIIRDTHAEQHAAFLNRKPEIKEMRLDAYMQKNVSFFTIEDFINDAWRFYQEGGAVTEEVDRLATSDKMRQAVNDADIRAWLEPQIAAFLGEPAIYNGKDPFTADGRSRSFAETHYTYTAENIVKAMQNASARGEGTMGANANALVSTATPSYGSIEEMHADKGRLRIAEEADYDHTLRDIDVALTDVEHDIMRTTKHHADNTYDEEQIIGSIIVDAAMGARTVTAVQRAFTKEGYKISTEQAKSILSLYDKAANVPTGYFEAKPERVVGFDEVGVFVIPRNSDVKLKQEILNRGYAIAEYDPDVEGDRQKVVNSFEQYKFSLSDVGETPNTYGDLHIRGEDVKYVPMEEDIAPVKEDIAPAQDVAVDAPEEEQRADLPITDIDYAPVVDERAELEARLEVVGEEFDALENVRESTVVQAHQGLITYEEMRAKLEEIKPRYNELGKERYDLIDKIAEMEKAEASMQSERINSITDADVPPEMEAPYYGESETLTADDPFENRDMKAVSRDRKTKAYMYENPEVKPFFQQEAAALLGELERTEKPQTIYNGWMKYEMSFEAAQDIPEIYRTKRVTTPDIAYLRDEVKMSYADIEKGLKAIIEDNGAENIAAAKKIEFVLNDRLLNGYEEDGYPVPPNQDYINLINEKQISEYSEEARKQFFEVADEYAPPADDVAPMADTTEDIAPVAEQYEAIRPKPSKEPRLARVKEGEDIAPTATYETARKGRLDGQRTMFPEGKTAQVMTEEPQAQQQKGRTLSKARMLVLDKQRPIEDLALKTKNRELMGKANYMLSSESRAQTFMGEGKDGVRALTDLRAEVESSGLEKDFFDYMYHKHNVDRMSLESKAQETIAKYQSKFGHLEIKQMYAIANTEITDKTTERTAQTIREAKEYLNALEAKNKPVFGDSVTAEVSQEAVAKFEKAHPEFKAWAKDVYGINEHLRGMLVDAGVISQETADLWADMYPNYVPIRRADKDGAAINVPLDTGSTGVNAPIKRATGGNSDILPMFNTLATRIEQTFKAVARNNFGIELKNTLGAEGINQKATLDEVLDNIDKHEELLQKGENGANPTFTVFENGERVTFEITEDLYDALKPNTMTGEIKPLSVASKIQRGLLTEYNPVFMATNVIKDVQDVLLNSQHAAKTYANMPLAIKELFTKGKWYKEYMENGGGDNTYFDNQKKTFTKEDTGLKKLLGLPFRGISAANNFIERLPRLAEYIASRKSGASVEVAMLDAARVTTNFAAGGDLTKWANRNGFTFLNASVQGFNQQVRNLREAKAKGLGGVLTLAAKFAVAGLPVMLLNHLMWEDDEEYEELSDYVKDSYYIVGKTEDGQFIRIPKGRALAVIQNGFTQMENLITGDDEVDMARFGQLLVENLAPNNPLDNNVFAPIMQVANNETWYGEDLVPTRLQNLPDAEQFDESTDALSKWLGEKLDYSPYKINYLLNQYSGGVGDVLLPMMTPKAESGDNSLKGNIIAPWKDKFTTDSVLKNQNVSDFYDTVDELTKNANSMYATDEDVLKYKYMNSVNSDLSELYQQKREIQNSDLPDDEKYNAVREVQRQIDDLSKEALNTYNNVTIDGVYATVGDRHYRWYEPSEDSDAEAGWQKISDKQLEKMENVTGKLGISASDYWSNKEEYDYAYDYPENYAVAKSVGGYKVFKQYSGELYDIKADKDEDGKSISGSRKEKVLDYINNLDADYGEKIILFKNEYNADDTYNYEIIDYLNSREDISYEEMATILKALGFDVDAEGNISWD